MHRPAFINTPAAQLLADAVLLLGGAGLSTACLCGHQAAHMDSLGLDSSWQAVPWSVH
jgi:hypothetical protein